MLLGEPCLGKQGMDKPKQKANDVALHESMAESKSSLCSCWQRCTSAYVFSALTEGTEGVPAEPAPADCCGWGIGRNWDCLPRPRAAPRPRPLCKPRARTPPRPRGRR